MRLGGKQRWARGSVQAKCPTEGCRRWESLYRAKQCWWQVVFWRLWRARGPCAKRFCKRTQCQYTKRSAQRGPLDGQVHTQAGRVDAGLRLGRSTPVLLWGPVPSKRKDVTGAFGSFAFTRHKMVGKSIHQGVQSGKCGSSSSGEMMRLTISKDRSKKRTQGNAESEEGKQQRSQRFVLVSLQMLQRLARVWRDKDAGSGAEQRTCGFGQRDVRYH